MRQGGLAGAAACCWQAAASGLAAAASRATKAKAKSVIQIWMWGGPSHLDTFDPKPEAGYDYCGPLNKPIATNVDGIRIGELLPLLAKQADKYSIIRSMTHGINAHETAAYMVQTGRKPGGRRRLSLRRAPWSRCSRATTPATSGLIPPYIVLTAAAGPVLRGRLPAARATSPSPPAAIRRRAGSSSKAIVAQGITDAAAARPPRAAPQAEHASATPCQDDPRTGGLGASPKNEAYDLILGDGGKVFDLSPGERPISATATAATRSGNRA